MDHDNSVMISLPYPKRFLIIYNTYYDRLDHYVLGRFNSISSHKREESPNNDYVFQIWDHGNKDMIEVPLQNIKSIFPFTDNVGQFLDVCHNSQRDINQLKPLLLSICNEINEQNLDIISQLKQLVAGEE